MDNKITFSVLVSAYNVEKYVGRCIDSVLNQTYSNFELILVDDGSTDQSGVICQEYAKKDARIKLIRQENSGTVRARRQCIQNASGEYYVFLDSDDYLELDALEIIQKSFEKYGCDCVVYGYREYLESEKRFKKNTELIDSLVPFFSNEKKDFIYQFFMSGIFDPLWRKAVKSSVLPKDTDYSSYYHISRANDLLQSLEIYSNLESVVFIDAQPYVYVRRSGSLTTSFNIARMTHLIEVYDATLNFLQKDVRSLFTPEVLYEIMWSRLFYPFLAQVRFVCCSNNKQEISKKAVLQQMLQTRCFAELIQSYDRQKKNVPFKYRISISLFRHKLYRGLIFYNNFFILMYNLKKYLILLLKKERV